MTCGLGCACSVGCEFRTARLRRRFRQWLEQTEARMVRERPAGKSKHKAQCEAAGRVSKRTGIPLHDALTAIRAGRTEAELMEALR